MKTTGTGVALLAALDHGAYRDAISRYESSHPTDDPVETIWRAEIALYLNRLDDARAELDRLGGGLDRDLTNRVQTIRAEIAFWDKALDEARELISPVIQSTWEAGDHEGHLRATLLRARIELRRGNQAEALERMKEPRRLATVLGNDYYAGIIAHCRAFAYYFQGEYKQAGQAFAEALHLLHESEGLRWELSCRTMHAGFLAEIGRLDAALAECDDCERVALDLGLVNDALYARNNAAGVLFQLGRFEEAIERLKDLLSWERAAQHVFAEITGLTVLSMALVEVGRFAEAERVASDLVQLGRLMDSEFAQLDGEIIRQWAAGRAGKPEAAEAIQGLIKKADGDGTDLQRCEARLYAADVLRESKPDVAIIYCREARGFTALDESVRTQNLLKRIEQALATGPMHFGVNGELVFDPRDGWPNFDEAVETLRRFLVLGAVRQSGGNRAEAARKLGLTRSRLHDMWRLIHGEPPRPLRPSELAAADTTAESLRQKRVERVDEQPSLS
jgi:tetratricopeptide (TPR) repeat protein